MVHQLNSQSFDVRNIWIRNSTSLQQTIHQVKFELSCFHFHIFRNYSSSHLIYTRYFVAATAGNDTTRMMAKLKSVRF